MLTLVTAGPGSKLRRRGKIYIRVSAVMGRKDLLSPEIQETACRQKADAENIEVTGVVYDIDASGRSFDNRKILDMIEEVRRGEYEVIIIYKWSRFGRNLRDSLNNLEELKLAGGVAISATEPGDSNTTMGRFTRNQLLMIAELQSDMLSDSWKDTHRLRHMKGLPHTGHEHFGYIRVDKERYEPEPITSDALAEVYVRYVEGETFRTIVEDMKAAGIRTKKGHVVTISRWIRIMETGFAAGLIRRRKPGATSVRLDQWEFFEGAHPAIISKELWQAFYDKRMSTLGRNWASTKAKYSVSGLLRCFRCGRRLVATSTRGRVYFRCDGLASGECRGVFITLRRAEEAVLEWINERAQGIESVEERARLKAAQEKVTSERDEIQRQIEDIDRRLTRLLDLYESGNLDKETYLARRQDRELEKSRLNQRLAELGAAFPERRPIPATFFKDLKTAWSVATNDERRNLLRKVIDHVVIYEDGHDGGRVEVVPRFAV